MMNPPPNPAAEQARAEMQRHNAEVEAHAQQAAMPLLDPLWRCRVHVEEPRGVLTWLSVDVMIDDWMNVMEMTQ